MVDVSTHRGAADGRGVIVATPADTQIRQTISTVSTGLPHTHIQTPSTGELHEIVERLHKQTALTATFEVYARASEDSGNVVHLDPRYGALPILVGGNDQHVLLYEFIEALDGITDYAQLKAQFPMLSFGQIAGALAFLRKLAQFNLRGVDIDRLEDELIEGSPEFQAAVEQALADRESVRVLTGE